MSQEFLQQFLSGGGASDYIMMNQRLYRVESDFSVSFGPKPKLNNYYKRVAIVFEPLNDRRGNCAGTWAPGAQ